MKKFRVSFREKVILFSTVEVEASNTKEALAKFNAGYWLEDTYMSEENSKSAYDASTLSDVEEVE